MMCICCVCVCIKVLWSSWFFNNGTTKFWPVLLLRHSVCATLLCLFWLFCGFIYIVIICWGCHQCSMTSAYGCDDILYHWYLLICMHLSAWLCSPNQNFNSTTFNVFGSRLPREAPGISASVKLLTMECSLTHTNIWTVAPVKMVESCCYDNYVVFYWM